MIPIPIRRPPHSRRETLPHGSVSRSERLAPPLLPAFSIRPLLLFLVFVLSSWTTTGPVPAQDSGAREGASQEAGDEAPEGQMKKEQTRTAKDAFVLLSSNQKRILGLGYDTSYSSADGSSSSSSADTGISSSKLRAAELAKAKKSLQITQELIEELGETLVTPQLVTMQSVQGRLSRKISGSKRASANSPEAESAGDLSLEFAIAESELEQLLPVSEQERSAILQRYWSRLTDLDGFGTLSSSNLDPEDLDTPPITAEEYRKKQERYREWQKEQARRQADQRREQDLRRQRQREREESRDRQAAEPQERPRAGIDREALERMLEAEQEEARGPSAEEQARMETWYTFWSRKSLPLKTALKVFLPMPLDRRTQELIRACQNLYQTSAELGVDDILNAPDPAVSQGLRRAVKAFESAGDHCMYGRSEQAAREVETARAALGDAVARLRYFNLKL